MDEENEDKNIEKYGSSAWARSKYVVYVVQLADNSRKAKRQVDLI